MLRFLEFTSGALNAEVGNYSEINTDGMFNVPLGDKLALRGAFQIVNRSGYSSEGFDDDKKESARLSLLWKPNDDVSLRVTAAYTHVGGMGPGYDFDTNNFPTSVSSQLAQITGAGVPTGGITIPGDPRISITDPRVANIFYGVGLLASLEKNGGLGVVGPFNGVTAQPWCLPAVAANGAMVAGVVMPLTPQNPGLCNASFNGVKLASPPGGLLATWDPSQWQALAHQNNRYWNVNAELNWDLGFANLTVIPSYRRVDNDYSTFPVAVFEDGGRAPETSDSESLEARLAKNTSLVDWVAGLYYFHEKQDVQALQYGGFLFNTFNPDFLGTTSYAAFTQATWHAGDQLRLITGLRYSQDHKTNTGEAIAIFPSIFDVAGQSCFNGPASGCVQNAFSGSLTSHAVNWKAGAEYDLTPLNMLYATASTGYKAGGLNSEAINFPVNDNPVPYKPESVTAFEIGSRNQFLERRLQVNLEGFYWLYKDHQENASFANSTGAFVPATVNAGAARLYGADLGYIAAARDTGRHIQLQY